MALALRCVLGEDGMYDMVKRHSVQVLQGAGHTAESVSRLTGVSVTTVKRIAQEEAVSTFDDAAERARRGIGRPSKVAAYRDVVVALCQEKDSTGHPLQAKEIVRRLVAQGYPGRKSAMYALIASLRPREMRPVVRFEGLAGEFTQHDFGQVDVKFQDGRKERIRFFASRLKHSRWVCVSLVPNEQTETISRSVVAHFEEMGGVPLMAVFDRPSTVVTAWKKDGTATAWNKVFAGVMLELGVGIELCWPARGNQKGSVENLVGWVKSSFFKQRTFIDETDLAEQLQAWLREVNTETKSRATGEIPETLRQQELPRLRPLKVKPADLALRYPVVAGPTCHVSHDEHQYLVPTAAMGLAGTLYLYRDRVKIVVGEHTVVYPRPPAGAPKQKLEHPYLQAELVSKAPGRRGPLYLMRQQLLDAGQPAVDFLTELVHRKPCTWEHDVRRLHQALLDYGKDSLFVAFRAALAAETINAAYVVARSRSAAQGGPGKSDIRENVAPGPPPASERLCPTDRRWQGGAS